MLVKNVTIAYPHIFKPCKFGYNDRYGFAFTVADDADKDYLIEKGARYNRNRGLFNSESNFKPKLTEKDDNYDLIEKAFRIAHIRNIDRDQLFRDMTVDLELSTYEYKMRHPYTGEDQVGIGLNTVSIILDGKKLLDAAMAK